MLQAEPILTPCRARTLSTQAPPQPRLACTAFTTSWHMQPTMAATDAESAPPLRGSMKPAAPDLGEG